MARHRPTELKALIALLDQEHEDVEQLAQDVLDLLMDIKWGRAPYIAIQRSSERMFVAWGPYATIGEAERDIGTRILGARFQCKNSCGTIGPACLTHAQAYEYAYFARVWNKDAVEPAPEIWEEA